MEGHGDFMWQELINHQSFPYSEELNYYLDADSNFYQNSITANKFSLAGECFLELAKKLDIDSETWLRKWQNNSYGEAECSVDYDWGDWLSSRTQQSVNVNFLSRYRILTFAGIFCSSDRALKQQFFQACVLLIVCH